MRSGPVACKRTSKIMAAAKPTFAMRAWIALTWAAHPLLKKHLQSRVKNGKEDPNRWREKLGETQSVRPSGRLIWLHAVGLGEVLALRGLVHKLSDKRPDWHFLITSGTRTSAQVLADNMPPRCIHQFLPIDTPQAGKRFLKNWRPDIAIWAEQELWPGLTYQADARAIPMAMVNARMNAESFAKRRRVSALYADALARVSLISAQDEDTAEHLRSLGAKAVRIEGSLKPIAPPLDGAGLSAVTVQIGERFVWVVGSSHPADEVEALSAHRALLKKRPDALLIIAPRDVSRGTQIGQAAQSVGLKANLRSETADMTAPVYVADTFGELGLWYRAAKVALIGGTFDETQGHNPWEAVQLSTQILHGPNTANFSADFADLKAAGGAHEVANGDDIAQALQVNEHARSIEAAHDVLAQKNSSFDDYGDQIVKLVEERHV